MPNPVAIKEIVEGVIQELTAKGVDKQEVAARLNGILGKKTLRHVKIERYENHKLIIKVDSSVWLYKLNLEKTGLLKRLNSAMPDGEIKELLFKLG